ncbi:hypothetical protein B484DRAFT_443394 [Ochromonadaceae sp. CCMP2298]|nr:hypothetical protein B484DRAFT_443394 [Ochromonadaceae sp. CCMP2298]
MGTELGTMSFVPEVGNGFYDWQISALLEIFPSEQLLVLLQEETRLHTFTALRAVEEFLQIPCFDFSAVQVGGSSPPSRVPVTLAEKVQHYKVIAAGYLESWGARPYAQGATEHLLSELDPPFRAWLEDVYRPHNRRLSLLGERRWGGRFAEGTLRAAGWQL